MTSVLDGAVSREPLVVTDGKSGSAVERVTRGDGSTVIVKRISAEWDWLMRAANDDGRVDRLWRSGLLRRCPDSVDHAMIGVESDGNGWLVVMRDVADVLLADDRILTRQESRQVMAAASELHAAFAGTSLDGLCTLEDRYQMFSPSTAEREKGGTDPVPKIIGRGWERFAEVVEGDVADAALAIMDQPRLLARAFDGCPTTLIHGDLKAGNLGLDGERVVMIDWSDRVGLAPPWVEFAWYLAINPTRISASREELLADATQAMGELRDPKARDLALLGALLQLGWNKAFEATESSDAATRVRETADLVWWVDQARVALDRWGVM